MRNRTLIMRSTSRIGNFPARAQDRAAVGRSKRPVGTPGLNMHATAFVFGNRQRPPRDIGAWMRR
jgi:hypothetical protein